MEAKNVCNYGEFEGFKTIQELMDSNCTEVPSKKGVYMILRKSKEQPGFLEKGSGGFFKEKDPNVSIKELKNNWIDNEPILYIGQTNATLQKRLRQYMQFGQGKKVGHWGGRYIWQLKDSKELIVCWAILDSEDPKEKERQMIQSFKEEHNNKFPFANLRD